MPVSGEFSFLSLNKSNDLPVRYLRTQTTKGNSEEKLDLSCPFSLDACGNLQGPVVEDNRYYLVGASTELSILRLSVLTSAGRLYDLAREGD